MRKFFRISPQQSIHQASIDFENFEIKLRGRPLFIVLVGEGGEDYGCVTKKLPPPQGFPVF